MKKNQRFANFFDGGVEMVVLFINSAICLLKLKINYTAQVFSNQLPLSWCAIKNNNHTVFRTRCLSRL